MDAHKVQKSKYLVPVRCATTMLRPLVVLYSLLNVLVSAICSFWLIQWTDAGLKPATKTQCTITLPVSVWVCFLLPVHIMSPHCHCEIRMKHLVVLLD